MTHSFPTRRSSDLRIYYYDWQVRQMCAVDGCVKVYETVVLPAAKFDRYGNIGVKNERYAGALDEYYFKTEDKYLRTGNPTLIRSTTRIIRRSDGMVLGEATRYGRGGGDMHGPRSEEHTSEHQSLMRISYAVICLKKKKH